MGPEAIKGSQQSRPQRAECLLLDSKAGREVSKMWRTSREGKGGVRCANTRLTTGSQEHPGLHHGVSTTTRANFKSATCLTKEWPTVSLNVNHQPPQQVLARCYLPPSWVEKD
jgi:hypothetical protein